MAINDLLEIYNAGLYGAKASLAAGKTLLV
jgi:hypothetical protein